MAVGVGDIQLTGIAGNLTLMTRLGAITVSDAISSKMDLRTQKGRVYLTADIMPMGSCEIRSETGDITVGLTPESDCGMTAEVSEGSIDWRLPCRSGPFEQRGPQCQYGNIRHGSGSFNLYAKKGNINIMRKVDAAAQF